MTLIRLKTEQVELISTALKWFRDHFLAPTAAILRGATSLPTPDEVSDLERATQAAYKDVRAAEPGSAHAADSAWLPVIKRAVMAYRYHIAADVEQKAAHTHHAGILSALEQQLAPYDALLATDWMTKADVAPVPRLTDFFSVQRAEELSGNRCPFPGRVYDEKFHIHLAPTLFLPDLAYYREKCAMRGASLGAVFMDIDGFKKFNTTYRHEAIDRDLLPLFMRTVEAHVFSHGHAYRQGGDEYLLLLPNVELVPALAFLDRLRERVKALSYPGIKESTTVSAGLCLVPVDCVLTNTEVRERANAAAVYAKGQGKDCVATYVGEKFTPDELRAFRSPAAG